MRFTISHRCNILHQGEVTLKFQIHCFSYAVNIFLWYHRTALLHIYPIVSSRYIHLISNLIFQLLLGLPLELVHKFWRVLLIYVLGVIAGISDLFNEQRKITPIKVSTLGQSYPSYLIYISVTVLIQSHAHNLIKIG